MNKLSIYAKKILDSPNNQEIVEWLLADIIFNCSMRTIEELNSYINTEAKASLESYS